MTLSAEEMEEKARAYEGHLNAYYAHKVVLLLTIGKLGQVNMAHLVVYCGAPQV